MSSTNCVGPPRLLNAEVILQHKKSPEKEHCVLKISVENKSGKEGSSKEYSIGLPPNTLNTLIDSFGKIKNQLHLLTEKHNT